MNNNSIGIVRNYLAAMYTGTSSNLLGIEVNSFSAILEAIAFLLLKPTAIEPSTNTDVVKEVILQIREEIGGYGTEAYVQAIQTIIESTNENKQIANYILSYFGVYPSYYPDTRIQNTIINTSSQSPFEIIGTLQLNEEMFFHIFKQFLANQEEIPVLVEQFPYSSHVEVPGYTNENSPIPKVFHFTKTDKEPIGKYQYKNVSKDGWQVVSTVIGNINDLKLNTTRSPELFLGSGATPIQMALVYAYIHASYLLKYYQFSAISQNNASQSQEEIDQQFFIISEHVFETLKQFQAIEGLKTGNGRINHSIHAITSILQYFSGEYVIIPNPDFPSEYQMQLRDFLVQQQQQQQQNASGAGAGIQTSTSRSNNTNGNNTVTIRPLTVEKRQKPPSSTTTTSSSSSSLPSFSPSFVPFRISRNNPGIRQPSSSQVVPSALGAGAGSGTASGSGAGEGTGEETQTNGSATPPFYGTGGKRKHRTKKHKKSKRKQTKKQKH